MIPPAMLARARLGALALVLLVSPASAWSLDGKSSDEEVTTRSLLGDVRPVPDPTRLTTDQLRQAIGSLREIIEARLNAGDTATHLLQEITDRIPARIDEKIAALREFHEEKFNSIQLQFKERDTRVAESAQQTKVAVDAALAAAEKAAGKRDEENARSQSKSEAAILKQIDALSILLTASSKGLDDKITDAKDRLTRLEGRTEGTAASLQVQRGVTQTEQGSSGNLLTGIGIIVAAAIGLLALVGNRRDHA